jgi:hypothetical protein
MTAIIEDDLATFYDNMHIFLYLIKIQNQRSREVASGSEHPRLKLEDLCRHFAFLLLELLARLRSPHVAGHNGIASVSSCVLLL